MGHDRIHADNCLWVLCCCGCLPLIGLIKGLITVVPSTIIHAIPCFLISVILLPHDIYYTYASILRSKKIGPNITVLGMLLLPIPLLLWPECVLIAYFLVGAGYGLFVPIAKTFEEKYNLFCGGIYETLTDGCKNVSEFWHFNYNSYFTYLADFRSYKLGEGEKPFDISLIELFIGLVIGTSGAIIDGILFILLTAIKIVPGLGRSYYQLWKWYCEFIRKCQKSCLDFVWFGLMFPTFILANAVIPIGVALVAVFICLSGFFIGLSAGWVAHEEGIPQAYTKMIKWAKDYDEESNDWIYGNRWSCL